MRVIDIPLHRLNTHHLLDRKFASAAEAVAHFGAVQAQEIHPGLWALGMRVEGSTETSIDQSIADRTIIRTWPLRSTIHFVTAVDARWMVKLSAARVIQAAATRLRRLELDEETFDRSRAVITGALREKQPMTRKAIYEAMNAAGISTTGERGYHIIWYHAHEGLIGLGPREGKQPTIVLLDDWLPPARELSRDEALHELARRYFTSHGPANLKDFTWWSGLAPAEARAGLEAVRSQLENETIDGEPYWFAPNQPAQGATSTTAHLLPYVDEYMVAYQDRDAIQPPEYNTLVDSGNIIFHAPILIDGRVAGIWTRKVMKHSVEITPVFFRSISDAEREAFGAAVQQYETFLGLPARVMDVS
jgi:hypothetical protein